MLNPQKQNHGLSWRGEAPEIGRDCQKTTKRRGETEQRGKREGGKEPRCVQSTSFSNFFKVRKTVSAGRKTFSPRWALTFAVGRGICG